MPWYSKVSHKDIKCHHLNSLRPLLKAMETSKIRKEKAEWQDLSHTLHARGESQGYVNSPELQDLN